VVAQVAPVTYTARCEGAGPSDTILDPMTSETAEIPGTEASAAAALWGERDRDEHSTDLFTRDLDLPLGRDRLQVHERDRVYEIGGAESRA
jgi:hypothetical protein